MKEVSTVAEPTFAETLASYRSPRVPIAEADLSAIDPAWHDRALAAYGWPDGTVEQSGLDGFARIHPVPADDDLSELVLAHEDRIAAQQSFEQADKRWREELRAAYRAGSTAASLAEAVGLSQVRVQQLVAGARPPRRR